MVSGTILADMEWLIPALGAFFLLAVATVTDKFILDKTPLEPLSFALAMAVTGALVCAGIYLPIFLAEHGFFVPSGLPLLAVAVNGVAQFYGLVTMFEAVKRSEVSRVNPVVVALQPVVCLGLELLLPVVAPVLVEHAPGVRMLSALKLVGMGMIVVGGYMLSRVDEGRREGFGPEVWMFVLVSATLLAVSSVFANISYALFEERWTTAGSTAAEKGVVFLKAFSWGRWMMLAAGVPALLVGGWRGLARRRQEAPRVKPGATAALFVFGQVAGGVAILLQQYALKLGNPVLVTAMNGVQFFFVLAIMMVLTRFFPQVLKEEMGRSVLLKKVVWVAVLAVGVALVV